VPGSPTPLPGAGPGSARVRRFLWSQLRFRRGRNAALGSGILVAVLGFTLLTSAANTSRLEVTGTVARNWRTAYQILVRPADSFTPIERQRGLVRDNYLSGIFGGITIDQWRSILEIPSVEVAAPIANLGYVLPYVSVPIPIDDLLDNDPLQLYRLNLTWVANGGLSYYPDADLFVYLTRVHRMVEGGEFGPLEIDRGSTRPLPVCDGYNRATVGRGPRDPFDWRSTSYLACFSSLSPEAATQNPGGSVLKTGQVGVVLSMYFPVLLAAIDPVQETRLLRLDRTVSSGRLLRPAERAMVLPRGALTWRSVPVIASLRTFVDESLSIKVERLRVPASTDVPRVLASDRAVEFLKKADGTPIDTRRVEASAVYERLLKTGDIPIDAYWKVGSVRYSPTSDGRFSSHRVRNPASIWSLTRHQGPFVAPAGNEDVQFRRLRPHLASNKLRGTTPDLSVIHVVGRFDPRRLPGFSPLSEVQLETYYPPEVEPADRESRLLLRDRTLRPTMNLGGYISQPPLLLTTIDAARPLLDPLFYAGADGHAPISVIRVNVAGATGPDPVSRERIRRVAEAIRDRTGLAVDITAGSSPHPLRIKLPAGRFGQPRLVVREGWTKKGAAVAIITAVDHKSLTLFVLLLVVWGFFLANNELASVRSRRVEIGCLRCLGWSRRSIFLAILGELAVVGLLAGLAGSALAALLVKSLSLKLPMARTLLAAPGGFLLALGAGFLPAWSAARRVPLDAVRPRVPAYRRVRPVRGLVDLAIANLSRDTGRTLMGATALMAGVAALAFLLSVNMAFRGAVVGTLLGNVISLQVRAVDYLSVALAVALGGFSLADVLFLNVRERAQEIATLRSAGWRDSHIARLVALEGVGIGLLGGLSGAMLGLLLAALVGGTGSAVIVASGLAALAGVGVAAISSVVPALLIHRLAPVSGLARE
jgi:putative ABC transport system permease protein